MSHAVCQIRRLKRCAPYVAFVFGMMLCLSVFAQDKPTAPEPSPAPAPKSAKKPTVGYFRGKDGVITITNRPAKYLRSSDYVEVELKFDPIAIPSDYDALDAATKCSAGSIANLVKRYARQYNLDANLVFALIKAESNFNPSARSPKGACGLMQLMPGTAADMGVTRIFDPAQNIAGGTQYLAKMLSLFRNDVQKALAAYNAGPNAVREHNGIPPFQESQAYVPRVLAYARQFAREGVSATYIDQSVRERPQAPAMIASRPDRKCYTVRFHSGLTQPADSVKDEEGFYLIRYGNRVDLIRKEHVKEIEAPV
ncbi:MAG: hypothetical protein QG656_2492 [Candidatus Hydrogenedentes bacterium]|nr:hypothetical protein [Candidatus Hydrogenedentota bacterium]